ncbi:hypothetical protein PsorP6_015919 [Peronosclerospora sorghi]|uniref:Uncharacterized protein n=1 Tax=Peronosclerospora sorghi TaxID=230839 RepID=A0ACC0WMN9_9STRA|nr:hypothetical protein PsorP6_015919 [Peronosclerospora sorghi]
MKQWKAVVYAKTESEFDELWTAFQTAYYTEVIQYIQQTWIDPRKHRFLRAWTDRVPHFGHSVTSRGESARRMIKQYLPHSMNNIFACCERLHLAVSNSVANYNIQRQQEFIKICTFAQLNP